MLEVTKCRMLVFAVFLGLFLFTTRSEGAASLKHVTHSFVKIKTSEGIVIYIDPYGSNEYADSADIVLVTHEHSDHNDITRVRQKTTCQVIRAANALQGGVYQTFVIGTVTIRAVAATNSYHPKNSCVGYVVEFDSIRLYHAGDTGKITEMADLAGQNITYALIPMDPTYTMTPEVATEAAAMIQAEHDIPIHTADVSIMARFTSPNKLIVPAGSSIELNAGTSSVENDPAVPSMFTLDQNYPNPFNPRTIIKFSTVDLMTVTLKIYDLLGQEVATLVDRIQSAGEHMVEWDGKNSTGQQAGSGIYFYQLKANNGFISTKKMMLLK